MAAVISDCGLYRHALTRRWDDGPVCGNVGSEVERAYRRSDMLERRRAMMALWGQFLRGKRTKGNVVQLGV
jgi:hypothetical protein